MLEIKGMAGRISNDGFSAPITSGVAAEQGNGIDLMGLLTVLLEHLKRILLMAVVGALLAEGYTRFLVTPEYEATSKLYVTNSKSAVLDLSDLEIGTYLASDYIEVFKTWEVHKMVIDNLGLAYSYAQMQDRLTVENPTDTRILYITFTSSDPREAAAVANEYATVALKYIASTMATEEPNVMSHALEPSKPSSPNGVLNIVLGFLFGLLFSVAWVTVRYLMDDKVKTVDDIRKYTSMPTLAAVPAFASGVKKNGTQYNKRRRKN